jgi:hypothetical protein
MNMTISKGCAEQNFPAAVDLEVGKSVQTSVPSSSSVTGYAFVNIKRMTEDYYYVSQIHNTGVAV